MRNRWLLAIAVVVFLGVLLLFGGKFMRSNRTVESGPKNKSRESAFLESDAGFKSRDRGDRAVILKTHRAEQLVNFILPEVLLDGLSLEESIQRLMLAYVGSCHLSGETPLALTFDFPEDNGARLKMKLSSRSFTSAVKILAAAAGVKVTRKGLHFVFEWPSAEKRLVKQTIPGGDLKHQLSELLIKESEDESILMRGGRDYFTRLGIELDPDTKVEFDQEGLHVESSNSEDLARLMALFSQLKADEPTQMKTSAMFLNLPVGAEWQERDSATMSDQEMQLFMRQMAIQKGAILTTLPTVSARDMNPAVVEIINTVDVPVGDGSGTFETRNVGVELALRSGKVGFGQYVDADFSDTTFDGDMKTGVGKIRDVTRLKAVGFSNYNETRMSVQRNVDGSATILLLTSQVMDSTGRPISKP